MQSSIMQVVMVFIHIFIKLNSSKEDEVKANEKCMI